MECKDDRIPGLQADQGFEDRRGCRIGDRGNTCDDADRFRNIDQSLDFIFINDADSLLVAHMIDNIFAGKQVLCGFVFKDSSSCFLYCQLCQLSMLIKCGN